MILIVKKYWKEKISMQSNFDLNRYINSVGKRTFVKCYQYFKDSYKALPDIELGKRIPEFDEESQSNNDNSLKMKASFAKGIFAENKQIEALEICINARNLTDDVKKQAIEIYKSETGNSDKSLERLREELIKYGEELGAKSYETETKSYIGLKVNNRNAAEIHPLTKDKFMILIKYDSLPDSLKWLTTNLKEKGGGYSVYSLGAQFFIKSERDIENAKSMVKSSIEDLMKNNSTNEDIVLVLMDFLENCFKIQKNPSKQSSDNINNAFKNIKTGNYKNTKYKMKCFGTGMFLNNPFIAFLSYNQEVNKGIYPIVVFNTSTNDNNLSVLPGTSFDNEPEVTWPDTIKSKKFSFIINSIEDFDIQKENIISAIDEIIEDYHTVFSEEEREAYVSSEMSLNRIFYGPPGTGKTYEACYT